ncbi:hypothetical protein [Dichelobacter nodosus]|uniref:hypothetical protein n=1 Tax=Dichelobacter nodosus TaxID=870 RepID=UPI00059F9D3F|nr:hypothetical protein [Dichelobacter nodosus]
MSNLQAEPLSFNHVIFKPVELNDDQIWLTSLQLAQALGYKRIDSVSQIYRRNADEFSENMTQVIDFLENVKLRVSKKNFAFLTFQRMLSDNRVAAAISAVEISLSLIRKRVQRFYRAIFMPKICYGGIRRRTARFAVSFVAARLILRMLSPSYLALTAAVNLQLRKETANV